MRLLHQRCHVAEGHSGAVAELCGRQRVEVRGKEGAAVHCRAEVAQHSIRDGIPAGTHQREARKPGHSHGNAPHASLRRCLDFVDAST